MPGRPLNLQSQGLPDEELWEHPAGSWRLEQIMISQEALPCKGCWVEGRRDPPCWQWWLMSPLQLAKRTSAFPHHLRRWPEQRAADQGGGDSTDQWPHGSAFWSYLNKFSKHLLLSPIIDEGCRENVNTLFGKMPCSILRSKGIQQTVLSYLEVKGWGVGREQDGDSSDCSSRLKGRKFILSHCHNKLQSRTMIDFLLEWKIQGD